MFRLKSPSFAAVSIITLLGLGLRLFTAVADPFLHPWDERFHALVARNMLLDPLVPRLRPGWMLPLDYKIWCCNDVWLHKQPLFLWQMALSMKLFGVGLLQMRLPSVLISTLMIPLVYHISLMAGLRRRISLLAAVLMAFNVYHIDHASGYYGMDHNDVAFSFYILASVWAFFLYRAHKTAKWAVLTGVLVGAAVLCKWLVGLIVLAVWAIDILKTSGKAEQKKSIMHLLLASIVAAAVSMPWQLYILNRFPAESRFEYALNARHLTEVIENHGGTWTFYLEAFPEYFGNIMFAFVPLGLMLSVFSKKWRQTGYGLLCILFAIGVCFYSFIPATKILSFLMPFVPIALIVSALALGMFLDWLSVKKRFLALLVGGVVGAATVTDQAFQLYQHHTPGDPGRAAVTKRTEIYRNLSRYLRPNTTVVMLVPDWEDIDIMFYNRGIIAHSWAPGPEEFRIYAQHGVRIAYFSTVNGRSIPEYLRNYWNAYEIPVTLQ